MAKKEPSNKEPSKKEPLDPIFNDLKKIISYMHDKAGNPINPSIPPEILIRLHALEDIVAKLKEKSEETLKKAGLERPLPHKQLEEKIDKMPPEDRRALETSLAIGRELSGLYISFLAARRRAYELQTKKKETITAPNKKEVTKRKTKFRKIKGDKTWKKL